MTSKSAPKIVSGWFEILYRYPNAGPITKLADLNKEDYMMVGRPLAYHEFEFPMQVHMMADDHWQDMGLPRRPQAFDIYNMVHRASGDKRYYVMPLLLIDDRLHASLVYARALLDEAPDGRPLVALPLVRGRDTYCKFPSFRLHP